MSAYFPPTFFENSSSLRLQCLCLLLVDSILNSPLDLLQVFQSVPKTPQHKMLPLKLKLYPELFLLSLTILPSLLCNIFVYTWVISQSYLHYLFPYGTSGFSLLSSYLLFHYDSPHCCPVQHSCSQASQLILLPCSCSHSFFGLLICHSASVVR